MRKMLALGLACGTVFGFFIGATVGNGSGRHTAMYEIAKSCGTEGEADVGIAKIECRIKRHTWESPAKGDNQPSDSEGGAV